MECLICDREYEEAGGLAFSAPIKQLDNNVVFKYHICKDCFDLIYDCKIFYKNRLDIAKLLWTKNEISTERAANIARISLEVFRDMVVAEGRL